MTCGECHEFVRGSRISHWGECFKAKKSVRDSWDCSETGGNMTAQVVESEKECHRCKGTGERENRDGVKVFCETCGGAGRLHGTTLVCGSGK